MGQGDTNTPVDPLWYKDAVIYELHVGTFTREGNWIAAAAQLQNLAGGLTGKSGTNQAGGQADGLVQGLGGLLGGKTSASSNAPATQPATNQSPAANPLNRFLNPKK